MIVGVVLSLAWQRQSVAFVSSSDKNEGSTFHDHRQHQQQQQQQQEERLQWQRWRYDSPSTVWSETDLSVHDGSKPALPLLLSVGGFVFDVTAGHRFYGPGATYHCFAAKAVSRALALGSLDPEDIARGDDVSDFDQGQWLELRDRVSFYQSRYDDPTCGYLGRSAVAVCNKSCSCCP